MLWDSRLTTDFFGVVAAKYVHRQAQFCLRLKADRVCITEQVSVPIGETLYGLL